jgi:hypothetical protein
MLFTNPIMTTHANRIIDWPSMSSMATKGYESADVMNPIWGYRKPFIVIVPIFYHKVGHYVKPNKVAFKYPDFKKDVDPDVHIKVFNFAVKENAKTSKIYIINAFSYMLRNTTSIWYHNYMSKFLNYIFWSLHKHFANVIGRFRMTSKYTWS